MNDCRFARVLGTVIGVLIMTMIRLAIHAH